MSIAWRLEHNIRQIASIPLVSSTLYTIYETDTNGDNNHVQSTHESSISCVIRRMLSIAAEACVSPDRSRCHSDKRISAVTNNHQCQSLKGVASHAFSCGSLTAMDKVAIQWQIRPDVVIVANRKHIFNGDHFTAFSFLRCSMATHTCSKPPTKSFTVEDILNSQKNGSDSLLVNGVSRGCTIGGSGQHALRDEVCTDTSLENSTHSDSNLEKQKEELSSFMTCCRQWTWAQNHCLPTVCELQGWLIRFLQALNIWCELS